jgi:hypothetical protein
MLQQLVHRMETEFRTREQAQQNAEGLVPLRRRGIVRRAPAGDRGPGSAA